MEQAEVTLAAVGSYPLVLGKHALRESRLEKKLGGNCLTIIQTSRDVGMTFTIWAAGGAHDLNFLGHS